MRVPRFLRRSLARRVRGAAGVVCLVSGGGRVRDRNRRKVQPPCRCSDDATPACAESRIIPCSCPKGSGSTGRHLGPCQRTRLGPLRDDATAQRVMQKRRHTPRFTTTAGAAAGWSTAERSATAFHHWGWEAPHPARRSRHGPQPVLGYESGRREVLPSSWRRVAIAAVVCVDGTVRTHERRSHHTCHTLQSP